MGRKSKSNKSEKKGQNQPLIKQVEEREIDQNKEENSSKNQNKTKKDNSRQYIHINKSQENHHIHHHNQKGSVCTWEQVSRHDRKEDVWVVINQDIYNLTKFVDKHPGGSKVVMNRAGRMATKTFESAKHPNSVFDKLKKYKIGSIDNESKMLTWQRQIKGGRTDAILAIVLTFSIILFMFHLYQ